jgi:Amidohydrolase family
MMRLPVLLGLAGLTAPAALAAQQAGGPLALQHVLLVDGTDRPPIVDATVVIADGHIVAAGPGLATRIPPGARRVDLRGRVVIPGLWDMHVHISGPRLEPGVPDSAQPAANRDYFWPMLLAYGVVGVREMAGPLDVQRAWRKEIDHAGALGPHLVITGQKLGHAPVVPSAPWPIKTDADVHTSIALLKAGGADFIKIDLPSGRFYPAVVSSAREFGLSFVGHVPLDFPVDSAARLGQRSVEHLQGVLLACSTEEPALRQGLLAFRKQHSMWDRLITRFRGYRSRAQVERRIAATYDTARAARLFDVFHQTGVWQVPTLTLLREVAQRWEPEESIEDSLYAPREIRRRRWQHRDLAPSPVYDLELRIVGAMRRAGVRILAGTDASTADVLPGQGLHDELYLLTLAGLSPLEALQAATRDAAVFLGAADTLGTVEPGKVADLVVLDANPLDDIRNTAKIRAVVRGGRYLDRGALDAMLLGVRRLVLRWDSLGPPPPPGTSLAPDVN